MPQTPGPTPPSTESTPVVSIRAATDADMAAVTAIYAHHVETGVGSFELTPPSLSEMSRRRADVSALGHPYLVAEVAGRIAGFAYSGPYRARPAYRFTAEDSVYVHPDHQRLGVGVHLLSAVIDHCTRAGFRQMLAVIGGSENVGSKRLHEKLGFSQTGLLKATGFKFGRWLDSIIMQRGLGPGASRPPND